MKNTQKVVRQIGKASRSLVMDRPGRKLLVIQHRGATKIYLDFGQSSADVSTGFELVPGAVLFFDGEGTPGCMVSAIGVDVAQQLIVVLEGW